MLPFIAITSPSHSSVLVRGASTETSQKRQHRGVSAAILTRAVYTRSPLLALASTHNLAGSSVTVFFFDTSVEDDNQTMDVQLRSFSISCLSLYGVQLAERGGWTRVRLRTQCSIGRRVVVYVTHVWLR